MKVMIANTIVICTKETFNKIMNEIIISGPMIIAQTISTVKIILNKKSAFEELKESNITEIINARNKSIPNV